MHDKRVLSFWQDDLRVSLMLISVGKLEKCWSDESSKIHTLYTNCAVLDTEVTKMNKT